MKPLFWTDMPSKTTVTQKGVTTVSVRTTGHVIVASSDNEWMNEDFTDDWADRVFGNMAFEEKRLLVWDSFRSFIKDRIEMVRKRNAVMAVIQ